MINKIKTSKYSRRTTAALKHELFMPPPPNQVDMIETFMLWPEKEGIKGISQKV
jgi:hypothetical protein